MKESQMSSPTLNEVSTLIDNIVFSDAVLARLGDSVSPQTFDDPRHRELLWCRSKVELNERDPAIAFQSLRVFYSSHIERDLIAKAGT